jgi:hypothetical protein
MDGYRRQMLRGRSGRVNRGLEAAGEQEEPSMEPCGCTRCPAVWLESKNVLLTSISEPTVMPPRLTVEKSLLRSLTLVKYGHLPGKSKVWGLGFAP